MILKRSRIVFEERVFMKECDMVDKLNPSKRAGRLVERGYH